ncbi:chromatin assembly factor 1 subunit B [Xylona heveae TC161]|uniref:Chromatin assembly factor 1 subunit B n=1 Tax=Xylona heveae (strain CBS 132557 / TC161) TaxID=1328760 RepID=A0A165JGT7_XYLHT|nr:chromatin assembly factor 1 subunit B [Xylona heveae TC161]KZF26218.1 chromatin assembly factor 1 subunit B [Xylona heveae TC161]
MKAAPLLVAWHNENAPIYSAHFQPTGSGRLATCGGDNNIRLWKLEPDGDDRKVVYLSTLVKHTQAVNVVRWCPRGDLLCSAGDDGNALLWVPSESQTHTAFGEDTAEDKETWRVKHMCRSFGSEIYDLAWSPDGVFFITGSMDNVARIYNAQTAGQMVRQIAEHNHYVQGVAWDPLNEFVATQSSDRSVHIYTLKTKDGQFTLAQHGKVTKMDLPARRISSSSPAPPDLGNRPSVPTEGSSVTIASPAPSAPGTPNTGPLPMNPPAVTHSRRSSFGSSPSIRRSASPAPTLPLPAVRPMENSPGLHGALSVRNTNIYANETFTSFFRRLTFAPDGSLLFTPAGQYKTSHPSSTDPGKTADDVINTVYIYTRAGFNKPPIAHLPGHKKPSIAVKCSPVYYTHRQNSKPTRHIVVDTSSAEEEMPTNDVPAADTSKPLDGEANSTSAPPPAFALPYRMVYAVATQDAVLVYDTQQQTPLCIVSNLHFATFTDLTWSNDGLTLLMSSSDGFCSALTFAAGELGQVYTGSVPTAHHPTINIAAATASSVQSTPTPTPTSTTAPAIPKQPAAAQPLPSPSQIPSTRPVSPTRSSSTSSVATQSGTVISNPTPVLSSVPSVAATHSSAVGVVPLTTPPQTPLPGPSGAALSTNAASILGKRDSAPPPTEGHKDEGKEPKKRRIAPTLVSVEDNGDAPK